MAEYEALRTNIHWHVISCVLRATCTLNALDANDDPSVWHAPKLRLQLDRLVHVILRMTALGTEETLNLSEDLIVLQAK